MQPPNPFNDTTRPSTTSRGSATAPNPAPSRRNAYHPARLPGLAREGLKSARLRKAFNDKTSTSSQVWLPTVASLSDAADAKLACVASGSLLAEAPALRADAAAWGGVHSGAGTAHARHRRRRRRGGRGRRGTGWGGGGTHGTHTHARARAPRLQSPATPCSHDCTTPPASCPSRWPRSPTSPSTSRRRWRLEAQRRRGAPRRWWQRCRWTRSRRCSRC